MNNKQLKIDSPAIYRITVQGKLDINNSQYLLDMQIIHEEKEDASSESSIIGKLEDQAALAGILNYLYELHMPVISVECLEKL
jgi:hypothetical protein